MMVAMQKGRLSLVEHYQRCVEVIGNNFVVGLPSNAKSVSRQEVLEFVKNTQPRYVHFLGCSETSLLHEVAHNSVQTEISCDATKIRKHIGKGRLLTEMHHSVLDDAISNGLHGISHNRIENTQMWDETEIVGDLKGFLDDLSLSEMKSFTDSLGVSENEIFQAEDNDALWCKLDEVNYGYADQLVISYVSKLCRKRLSPKVRTQIVHELAELDVI
jgi:hypothetical protein